MKKLVIALTAVAAFYRLRRCGGYGCQGSPYAQRLRRLTLPSWTGFYIGGGGGYGLWNAGYRNGRTVPGGRSAHPRPRTMAAAAGSERSGRL